MCIISQPDSLFEVFKARYFLQTSFQNATLGTRPSYVWRSILEGRQVLELGLRYQVGNGGDIAVWDDKWVPIPSSFQLNLINRLKWPDAKVQDLLIPDGNAWNRNLLDHLFLPYEVEAILQIPLFPAPEQDRIVWHHTANGQYSVKSGYKVFQAHQASQSGCTSVDYSQSKKSIWNTLWKWPTLTKIKHFIWRAMHNSFPLGANLAKRKILAVNSPHCLCSEETDKHAFLDCSHARKVWNMLGLKYLVTQIRASSFLALVSHLINQKDEHTVNLFFATTWLLWKSRCTKCFEGKETPPSQIVSNVLATVRDASMLAKQELCDTQLVDKWNRPAPGLVTVNVDASVEADGSTGFGVLIRDHAGNIVAAQSGPLEVNISVEHAELLAMVKGLELAASLSLRNVHIITDSQLACNRLSSKEKDYSLVSPLVQRIRHRMDSFEGVMHSHVRREGNVHAHLLARLGVSMCNSHLWGSKPPNDVLLAVTIDNASSNI